MQRKPRKDTLLLADKEMLRSDYEVELQWKMKPDNGLFCHNLNSTECASKGHHCSYSRIYRSCYINQEVLDDIARMVEGHIGSQTPVTDNSALARRYKDPRLIVYDLSLTYGFNKVAQIHLEEMLKSDSIPDASFYALISFMAKHHQNMAKKFPYVLIRQIIYDFTPMYAKAFAFQKAGLYPSMWTRNNIIKGAMAVALMYAALKYNSANLTVENYEAAKAALVNYAKDPSQIVAATGVSKLLTTIGMTNNARVDSKMSDLAPYALVNFFSSMKNYLSHVYG
jgi:hypothetical protein